jgi:hypothetical protein
MFTVFYTNFGYGPEQKFQTLEAALEYGKSKCFEFQVSDGNGMVASWSPIGGTRTVR